MQGKKTLADLFEGRSQLIVGQFMFSPDWNAGCVGCSFANEHVDAAWPRLKHHHLTYVAVTRAEKEMTDAGGQGCNGHNCSQAPGDCKGVLRRQASPEEGLSG